MAISYVGGVVAGRAGDSRTTINVALDSGLTGGSDSGVSAGDLVVVTVCSGSAGRSSDVAISGYTNLDAQRTTATTYDTNLQVSYKFMPSTPDSVVTIPIQSQIADGQAYLVQVFRGVDPTTPLDVTPTYATGSGANTRPVPSDITPTTTGAWIVVTGGGSASTASVYTNTSLTNFLSAQGNDSNDGTVGGGYFTGWTSGIYTPNAFSGGSNSVGASWGATTIALRPALDAIDQVVNFTLDDVSSTTTQTLQHNQTLTSSLDSLTVAISQSVSATVLNKQSLAITLDDVTASVTQHKTQSQIVDITLDDVTGSFSQGASHPQALAITLDGIAVSVAQGLTHDQSLNASLDGITASFTQSVEDSSKQQALNITLDSINAGIEQNKQYSQELALILDDIQFRINQRSTILPQYPLAGIEQDYALAGIENTYLTDEVTRPLNGIDNTYPLNGIIREYP